MIRRAGLSALLTFLVLTGFAQDDSAPATTRKSAHYVGIQANQLVRQLFSLSNSNSVINNPYLMTYAVNSVATGVGLNVGLGANVNEFKDDFGTLERESKINDIFFRIGIEKKSSLTKRWYVSWGFDVVIDHQKDNTKTKDPVNSNFTTETNTKVDGWGIGPRCALYFQITDKIMMGTEANYYFKSLKTTNELKNSFSSTETDSSDVKRFQLNVPAVLFLVLKL